MWKNIYKILDVCFHMKLCHTVGFHKSHWCVVFCTSHQTYNIQIERACSFCPPFSVSVSILNYENVLQGGAEPLLSTKATNTPLLETNTWDQYLRPLLDTTTWDNYLRPLLDTTIWDHHLRPLFEITTWYHHLRPIVETINWNHYLRPLLETNPLK